MANIYCPDCGDSFDSGKGLDCPNTVKNDQGEKVSCKGTRQRRTSKAVKCTTCGKIHNGLCPDERDAENPKPKQNFIR